MSTNPLRKLMCVFGRHRRSRGLAYDDGRLIRSVCRYCGVAMKRDQGKWMVEAKEAADPPPT